MAEVGETDGIVTVAVECPPMYDSSNGIVPASSVSCLSWKRRAT